MAPFSPRWDVFIAHAGTDPAPAEALYDLLSPHLRVFLDTRCLLPGDNWPRVLPAALRASSVAVVLVSQRVDAAFYANEQIAIAIELADRNPDQHRVIPLLLEDLDEQRAFLPYGLRSKHGLFARTPDETARAAARLVALVGGAMPAPAPGTRVDDVWAPPADEPSPSPAPAVVPASAGSYPPLRFLPDHGDEVWVRDPAALADLLDRNPENGRVFLYRRYYERGGWDKANPGLCAALTVLIEQRHPDDPQAGLAAALYLLDPRRPYRDGTEAVDGFTALAAHLAARAELYRDALREKGHPLWLYLASRPDPAVRDGVRAFAAAFTEARAGEGADAAAVAVNRLIVWLRSLDGERGLALAGTTVAAPAELLGLSPAQREEAAVALADRTSLLSVWVEERAPDLSRLVATWRRAHPGDVATLPYALGAGVSTGQGEVRGPEDVSAGSPETARALWGGTDALRERVDRYLSTFHFVPLAVPALERLRAVPAGPETPAIAAYVSRHAAELREGTTRDRGARDGGDALLGEVVSVVFGALDAAAAGAPAVLSAEHPRVADDLAREAVAPLLSRALSGEERLARLAALLTCAAGRIAAASERPVERMLWARFLAAADDAITRARRAGLADAAQAPEAIEAEQRIEAVIPLLRERRLAPGFVDRHDREQAARDRLAVAIEARMDTLRTRAEAALDVAEREARARLRQQARRLPPLSSALLAASRSRNALGSLLAGLAVFACAGVAVLRRPEASRAVDLHSLIFPPYEEGDLFRASVSMAGVLAITCLVTGGIHLAAGGRAGPRAVSAAVWIAILPSATVGYLAVAGESRTAVLLAIWLAVAAVGGCLAAGWRWTHARGKAERWIDDLDRHPALAAEFREWRSATRSDLARREAQWAAETRRAVSLAHRLETIELPSPPPMPEHAALCGIVGGWTRPLPSRADSGRREEGAAPPPPLRAAGSPHPPGGWGLSDA